MAISEKPGIAIVGAGAVGGNLVKALDQAGYTITALIDKEANRISEIKSKLTSDRIATSVSDLNSGTDIIIIAVPDGELEQVDRSIARAFVSDLPQACVHTSGAHSGQVLKSIGELGIMTGSLHPLQSFNRYSSSNLSGVYFALEGSAELCVVLEKIVKRLGGLPVRLPEGGKTSYHTAAVLASNFIPALFRSAVELLATLEIDPEKGRKMLMPLMQQMLSNCAEFGEVKALSGPIARGDHGTVEKHLAFLAQNNPALLAIYKLLSLKTLEIAIERGLEDDKIDHLINALSN